MKGGDADGAEFGTGRDFSLGGLTGAAEIVKMRCTCELEEHNQRGGKDCSDGCALTARGLSSGRQKRVCSQLSP